MVHRHEAQVAQAEAMYDAGHSTMLEVLQAKLQLLEIRLRLASVTQD